MKLAVMCAPRKRHYTFASRAAWAASLVLGLIQGAGFRALHAMGPG